MYYFTRGNKVGLRKIDPETVTMSRNIDPGKLQGILANYYQSMEQRSKSPMENSHTVIGQQASACDALSVHPYTVCLRLYCKVHCLHIYQGRIQNFHLGGGAKGYVPTRTLRAWKRTHFQQGSRARLTLKRLGYFGGWKDWGGGHDGPPLRSRPWDRAIAAKFAQW